MSAPLPKLVLGKKKVVKLREATEEEKAIFDVREEPIPRLARESSALPPRGEGGEADAFPEEKPVLASGVKGMFGASAPPLGGAKAPPLGGAAKAPLALGADKPKTKAKAKAKEREIEEEAEVRDFPTDLAKFNEQQQDLALDILSTERQVPYLDKENRPVFPLQSRLGFQQKVLKVYREFASIPSGQEPDFDACKKLGVGAQQEVEMYQYQKFVREYTRQATPYRGLLVYHGLGSGKTCSAIAAAEALFSTTNKKVIVMTPASLRDNFIREVSFCGFRHYHIQNNWVKIPNDKLGGIFAKEILGLSDDYIKRAVHFWAPDFNKPPNFSTFTDETRSEILFQIQAQIQKRIKFISYNGITAKRLKQIACAPKDKNGYGFFDNAIIIVDEIHNLTRLMQGTIEPYLTVLRGYKRKIPLEVIEPGPWNPKLCKTPFDPRRPHLTNYKRGYLLYRLLATAKDSKIIGLSGTPLINFPEEIGILSNLIGGYITTVSFVAKPANDANKEKIEEILNANEYIDFVDVDMAATNMNVLFSILPDGMKKVTDTDGTLGVQRLPSGTVSPSYIEITKQAIDSITGAGINIVVQPTFKSEPLLPPIGEDFRTSFLQEDGKKLKNEMVLRKRLQGLISYYRGSKKELMPLVTKDVVVRVPFSYYSQVEYQRIRGEELKKDMEKKKGGDLAGVAGKLGALWSQLYEIQSMQASNSYRMFSRQSCNFAFPEGIVRPRPSNTDDAKQELGKETEDILNTVGDIPLPQDLENLQALIQEEELDEEVEQAPRPAAAGGGGGQDQGEREDVEGAQAEDEAIDLEAKKEAVQEAVREGNDEEAEEAQQEGELAVIPELAAPAPAGAAVPAAVAGAVAGKKTLTSANIMRMTREKEIELCKKGRIEGEPYANAIYRVKNCLSNYAPMSLRLFHPSKKLSEEIIKDPVPLDPTRLVKYSPKYASILVNILQGPGSSLVYSNFLDMEGIGIFQIVMKANGFEEIQIVEDESGQVTLTESALKSLRKGPGVNRYLSFTGKEKRKVRVLALKLFNARFTEDEAGVPQYFELPPQVAKVLVESGFKGNLRGELCKVFCITGAGAEGISLKNVRRVHIMEPHWNHVRTDQVKGRAVRICSHIDLDYNPDPALNQRTVEVFTYVTCFNTESVLHPEGIEGRFPRIDQTILNKDILDVQDAIENEFPVPEGARAYVLTTDEYLYMVSQNKKKILEGIQTLMKESAVDCRLNEAENEEEVQCLILPGNTKQYAYHPVLSKDIVLTNNAFGLGKAAGAAGAAVGAAAGGVLGAVGKAFGGVFEAAKGLVAPAPKPVAPTIKARILRASDKQKYIAVPIIPKGQVLPLSYDVYGGTDFRRVKKLGSTLADQFGMPSVDVELE